MRYKLFIVTFLTYQLYTSSLQVVLANRLVLNLRTHSQSNNLSNPGTKTDVFFQQAYGGTRGAGRLQSSMIDSVLGNIGAPLRVDYDLEDGDFEVDELAAGRKREHSTEGRVDRDPSSPEGTQRESMLEA